ncbi:COG4 transport protein-domain-containing protein [Hysterangium stoloniferum]|nr:COG4 transport protein-domain-containing protein [Hysterangium stoloniferum]
MESFTHPVHTPSRSITTLPALLSSLSGLQSREAALSTSLTNLLSTSEPLVVSLSRIHALAPRLEKVHDESIILSKRVSYTACTAERVGGKVRVLDEEMKRVREAADRVAQVMELKLSLASLQAAMDSQDWESATRHCARAMSVSVEVISGPFAEIAVPTAESPLPPVQTLQNARESLLSIFRTKFQEASQSRDAAATSRFFKLFPVIGWEEEGLQAYSSFVIDLVRTRIPASAKTSSPMYYITMLTSLFEGIALIVDQHQPIVEKYYGRGKMFTVVKSLLEECDRVVKRLVEGWEEERSMKRKLAQTSNPTFFFLSPSSRKQMPTSAEDEIDPRDVDRVLSELAGMAGRWGLFRRFLCDRLKDYSGDGPSVPSVQDGTQVQASPALLLIQACSTASLIDELLTRYYLPLEIWYLRVTTDKAHCLSTSDVSNIPPTTTTPDDFFYILKIVLHRLSSTSSLLAVQRMTTQVKDVVSRDYAFVIKKRLEDVYKHASISATGPQRDKAEKELKSIFITHLNDLDISSSHIERLVKDLLGSSVVSQNFLQSETSPVVAHISALLDLVPQFQTILRSGTEQLFNQLARPRLRSLVIDVYKDVTYMLDDESYSLAESQDIVRKRFIRYWEALMDGFKEVFTDTNYSVFIHLAVDILVRPWEKYVTGMRFTELGAIRFDRDIRSILGYMSSQTTFGDGREKFQRLQQISTLLNLDVEEDGDEFYNNSGINWRLSVSEARMVIALRI